MNIQQCLLDMYEYIMGGALFGECLRFVQCRLSAIGKKLIQSEEFINLSQDEFKKVLKQDW